MSVESDANQINQRERRIVGRGYTIEFIGRLPESRQVLVTLPGAGDVALLHYKNLTENLDDKPLGYAVSYQHDYNPKELVSGLVSTLGQLAETDGEIKLTIHACSYGASLLPELVLALREHPTIQIQGIIARAPLFDIHSLSDRFQDLYSRGRLASIFEIGLNRLIELGEIPSTKNFARVSELLSQLPASTGSSFFDLLLQAKIPMWTVIFTNDQVINNSKVEKLIGEASEFVGVASGEARMGHYPSIQNELNLLEQSLLRKIIGVTDNS